MDYVLEHRTHRKLSHGKHTPQGASLTPDGVNFALYSRSARAVYLLLFDRADGPPTDIIRLEHFTKHVWHVFVHGVAAGQLYAFKVQGDFLPHAGLRFNDAKLLLDPYAKALQAKVRDRDNLLLAYDALDSARDLSLDRRDNTELVPKCIVVDDYFDWQGDVRPDLGLENMFLYEAHLKGFTAHPSSGVSRPGTYQGLVEKIPYLKHLGINAIELMPIHEICVEDFLIARGLTNYWGYNTIGFFAPESSYKASRIPGSQVDEFKTMVRALHRAGIEVILDVVYNHTAEGSELGPTLSFRGIDNPTYYVLTGPEGQPGRHYLNHSGCGNMLNLANPQVLRLVMDSLRYWADVMHVDGFRFDLASVLGHRDGRFQRKASFFDAISQDPILSRVKLIAEPWDVTTYQIGNFPLDWSEWNGRFRDTLRKFGKGDRGQIRELGWRLTGSADLYGDDGRSAYNSINFITCHDGFTLRDLVSYDRKHNEANAENNRDGTDANHSWNCGSEGETDNAEIARLRLKLVKNYACYLLFSNGTPMILAGDEFLRTQRGNNNAYCQDNEIGWIDWSEAARHADVTAFFRKAIAFNKRHSILHRRKFFSGKDGNGNSVADLTWFGPDGRPPNWDDAESRTLCYQLDGSEEVSELGDYRLFFILNADHHPRHIVLPTLTHSLQWYRVVDTSLGAGKDFANPGDEILLTPGDCYSAAPRSTVVLIGR